MIYFRRKAIHLCTHKLFTGPRPNHFNHPYDMWKFDILVVGHPCHLDVLVDE
jgi:hypothetical protein